MGERFRDRHGDELVVKRREDLRPGDRVAHLAPFGFEAGASDESLAALGDLYEAITGGGDGLPRTPAVVAHMRRVVSESLARGDVVFVRPVPGEARVVPKKAPSPPDPVAAPPKKPKPPPALHYFAARWVDDVGQAIGGAPMEIAHAGIKDPATTSGAGVARIDDVPETSATVKVLKPSDFRKKLKPRWDTARNRDALEAKDGVTIVPLAGELPLYDLPPDRVRLFSVQPYVVRAKLVGAFFDTSKSFLLPTGLDGVRKLVAMYDDMPDVALLVVGHTDTAGAKAYNDPLSLERATALKDYLRGNADGWAPWYGKGVATEKRWSTREDRLMAMALPDAADKPRREGAVTWFRRTRSLDKASLEAMRHALITEYMALEGTSLDPGEAITAHGCGENFPEDPTADGVADADNRRVEVFFFDKELGVQPPPPGKNSAAGSFEYPEWVRRAIRTEAFPAPDPGMVVRLQVHDDEYTPMRSIPCELLLDSGDVLEDETDEAGWVEAEVPRAKQRIGVSYTSPSDQAAHRYDVQVIPPDALEDERYMNHIYNFGFTAGADGDDATALLWFQSSCRDVPVTGELDARTKQAVDAILQKTMLDQLEAAPDT